MSGTPNMRLAALPCGLLLAKHGRGRQPPRTYDRARQFYCACCIIFYCAPCLLHFSHYFSRLCFRYMKKRQGKYPGAWLPYRKLILSSDISRRSKPERDFPICGKAGAVAGGILEDARHSPPLSANEPRAKHAPCALCLAASSLHATDAGRQPPPRTHDCWW